VAPLLTVAAGVFAAETTFTPYDVARLRSVGSIAVSPDGTAVAYTLTVPRRPLLDEDGPAWEELHVVSRDGTSRPFVTGEVNVSAVRWMPDGRALSFLARRGKDTTRCLYVMRLDGGEARRVLAHEADIAAYSVSGDGMHVAFVAPDARSRAERELERKGFNQQVFEMVSASFHPRAATCPS
jgi:dipeptidyl aminopeptidase/acylaminoacyl peptidase